MINQIVAILRELRKANKARDTRHQNIGWRIKRPEIPDLVRFDQVQIIEIPELVPVHLWLDHTITNCYYIINCVLL